MGEMADYYNEYCDAFDDEPPEVKCKYCGMEGLEWVEVQGAWHLYNSDGDRHVCSKTVTADELAKLWP